MRAVFLAAGEGKRLRPFSKRPKPLVPLLGISLIERNILALREWGIKEFIIVTGCYDREIREYLGSGNKLGVEIKYLFNPTGSWETACLHIHFKGIPGRKVLLMMCDHIFQPDLLKIFMASTGSRAGRSLLAADRRLENVFDLTSAQKLKPTGLRSKAGERT